MKRRKSPAIPEVSDQRTIEDWFVRRGVTQFVRNTTGIVDAWQRAMPWIVVVYFYRGLIPKGPDPDNPELSALGTAMTVVLFFGAWALSSRLRGKKLFPRSRSIGPIEIVVFIFGPALASLLFGETRDIARSIIDGVFVLAIIFVWARLGIGQLMLWAFRHGAAHLANLWGLLARALPLLLVFTTFLFINAEVWQLAGTLAGTPFMLTIAVFVVLGAMFALVHVSTHLEPANTFETWSDVSDVVVSGPGARLDVPTGPVEAEPLSLPERANLGFVVLVGQAFQITIVAASVTAFFLLLGFLTMSEATTLSWTQLDATSTYLATSSGERDMVLTGPLVRVAVFLGAFSGMYFTVLLTSDDTYQREFASDLRSEIRLTLATRLIYLHHLRAGTF